MKKFLLSTFIMGFSFNLFASAVDCYTDPRINHLTRIDSIQLCKGSDGSDPVDCYTDPRINHLTRSESIQLCVGSLGVTAVDCYFDPRISHLTRVESILLCGKGK